MQLNGDGEIVSKEVTSTVWVQSIFDADENGLGTNRKRKSARYMPRVKLPLSSLVLGEVVQLLLNVIHDNGTAGIFTIGKFVPFNYLRCCVKFFENYIKRQSRHDKHFNYTLKNKENLFQEKNCLKDVVSLNCSLLFQLVYCLVCITKV